MTPRLLLLCCALFAPAVVSAADVTPAPSFVPGLLQATLGLAVVLALIWGAAWLTRRFSPAGSSSSSRSPIRVLATQALGQRERVVLIELGENWLLLGVAPGQVSALYTGPKSALPPSALADTTPFAKLLGMARRKREG